MPAVTVEINAHVEMLCSPDLFPITTKSKDSIKFKSGLPHMVDLLKDAVHGAIRESSHSNYQPYDWDDI